MKNYGANKATEFTRKQVNVIFAKAKAGELKVEKWVMSDFYRLADYYGYDDNGSVEADERKIMAIIDNMFKNNMEQCQELIDKYTETTFSLLSRNNQHAADRTFVE